jgi:ribonuclease E
MKRMLFNATHPEELRVAIVDGQKLLDLDIESAVRAQKKGNIYKGKVTRVEPSLEAAFVEYGSSRQGFLPLKEISRTYFQNYSPSTPMAQVKIEDVVKEGQELVVQVDKDERGTKGAALTTFISLAGRYLVLMPNNPKGGGISRRISGSERTDLRDALSGLDIPTDHALIARTAGIGRSEQELQWDLDFLLQLWDAIEAAAADRTAPFLIFQESNLIVRALRDYLRGDISEILIDEPGIHERAARFMEQVMPNSNVRLKLYEDNIPLFSRFQIEHQIETAYAREVRLSSGGALVIDHTEAVVAVDVNSSRATKGADIEETALQTNLEAVDEVARQLRIRDLGGLIVIDLIDMSSTKNQRLVENRLNDALKADRARVQVGRISRFGLLEMSRQRLRSSISDSNYVSCPRCEGTGSIRSVTSSALSLLRILEEEALKENTESIHAHLPIKTATYLLNEKRHELNQIESRLATNIVILPTAELDYPHFHIKRLKSEDLDELGNVASHAIRFEKDDDGATDVGAVYSSIEAPSINLDDIQSRQEQSPVPEEPRKESFLKRIWQALSGETQSDEAETDKGKTGDASGGRGRDSGQRGQGRRSGGSGGRGQSGQGSSQGQRKPQRDSQRGDSQRGDSQRGGQQQRTKPASEGDDNARRDRRGPRQKGDGAERPRGDGSNQNRKPRSGRGRGRGGSGRSDANRGDSPRAESPPTNAADENTGNTRESPADTGDIAKSSTTRTAWNRGGNRGRRGGNSSGNASEQVNQSADNNAPVHGGGDNGPRTPSTSDEAQKPKPDSNREALEN